MSLAPGTYVIKCLATNNFIGRDNREDKSLLPKPVFSLPPDSTAPRVTVENAEDDGYYIIKQRGGTFGTDDSALKAFLIIEDGADICWRITPRPYHGEDVYTVEHRNNGKGWVVHADGNDEDERIPVSVSLLIVMPSEPPKFPLFELFEFTRIDRED